ncbi:MAG: [FeFe] hydrogenase H-cluster maturation GTPase HydF [Eggerthellaceae bacterium]|nr:[FeFe] hydrogenase H-cluster maturation GTPase HydF [Eggerthellaceae bacterium]MDY5371337.1 [FeFe] hydrogenase H-cluster maturation GTPase HydF [Eggerthellaceae bacterium]
MGMHEAPKSERCHIGFFGLRNAGKSSLVNAVTGQDLSIVSNVKGTTTDSVSKAMELLPLGPVVIIDTPGLDDEGELGLARVDRALRELRKCDVVVLVSDAARSLLPLEQEFVDKLKAESRPLIVARNKADMLPEGARVEDLTGLPEGAAQCVVSATADQGIFELKELIARVGLQADTAAPKTILQDLAGPGDVVVMVVPIDSSAPKGRLILPQQLVLRELLDMHANALICQPEELADTLGKLVDPPRLVVTDSQAFHQVDPLVPQNVPLTSFSILMARYKGELAPYMAGAREIATLQDGDRVLIAEGCTHHRQCEDIGTVKMPRWIRDFSGAQPEFEFVSGNEFPEDLSRYRLIVHCGGCMLNEREMRFRVASAQAAGIPIVNYGIAIAHMNGILARSVQGL